MLATLLPRKYSVMTSLELVDQTLPLKQAGVESPGLANEVYAAKHQVRSFERVRRVLETLQWEEFETLPPDAQYRYIERVVSDIGVRPIEEPKTKALFLEISYADTDPNHAAQFLNELRDVYVAEKLAALRTQSEQLRDQMAAEVESDRQAHQAALEACEELQRVHGLDPTQQAPGTGRVRNADPVIERKEAVARDLQKAQADLVRAEGKRAELSEQFEGELLSIPAQDPVAAETLQMRIGALTRAIDDQRAIQVGKTPNHRKYKGAQTEIERLEDQIQELLDRDKQPVAQPRMVPNPKRVLLAEQIAALDAEIA